MTRLDMNRNQLLKFLSSVGKDIPDLKILCAGTRITVEVAYATYYIRKAMIVPDGSINKEGTFNIADLQKVLKFLKASKNDTVTLRQTAESKPFHIESGGNKLQIPSTNEIESASKVPIVRAMIQKASGNGWTHIGKKEITAHGNIDATDLTTLVDMKSLIAKESSFKLRMHCGENEFGIVAGKVVSGRLFTTLPMSNSKGPSNTIASCYGEWLPNCLNYLESKSTDVHMGEGTPVIFEQEYNNGSVILMVVDMAED